MRPTHGPHACARSRSPSFAGARFSSAPTGSSRSLSRSASCPSCGAFVVARCALVRARHGLARDPPAGRDPYASAVRSANLPRDPPPRASATSRRRQPSEFPSDRSTLATLYFSRCRSCSRGSPHGRVARSPTSRRRSALPLLVWAACLNRGGVGRRRFYNGYFLARCRAALLGAAPWGVLASEPEGSSPRRARAADRRSAGRQLAIRPRSRGACARPRRWRQHRRKHLLPSSRRPRIGCGVAPVGRVRVHPAAVGVACLQSRLLTPPNTHVAAAPRRRRSSSTRVRECVRESRAHGARYIVPARRGHTAVEALRQLLQRDYMRPHRRIVRSRGGPHL